MQIRFSFRASNLRCQGPFNVTEMPLKGNGLVEGRNTGHHELDTATYLKTVRPFGRGCGHDVERWRDQVDLDGDRLGREGQSGAQSCLNGVDALVRETAHLIRTKHNLKPPTVHNEPKDISYKFV